jgi:hypothetical protein
LGRSFVRFEKKPQHISCEKEENNTTLQENIALALSNIAPIASRKRKRTSSQIELSFATPEIPTPLEPQKLSQFPNNGAFTEKYKRQTYWLSNDYIVPRVFDKSPFIGKI